ncbi:sigma-70 family RNA polymerase sigma factor [Streptococcus sp. IsoGale021]|uniref:sigma-70 family RNA polymerase sigma factor n=1 Tax=Streptococcus TaxID=1301 RepID=UPI002000D9BB|nr:MULTISPECIES: sigma-70 family RNA polymerase sigma factor [Streptococcus]MCY7209788.1 sigma-70 family RNA polymerase sigma factor [Streptococcus anginosus]MCY7211459.1 sigma-70 family RNA polymerase sigma factor [Streptococcus anginosus]MCY7226586.1 sigma-70 family RNA polymerase sigma factor [Streptococcus anginosus]MDQ8693854.1 sigma-70 family RNA polymerase sigma factor [Streptococcus sp. IsoGale021]MDU5128902.1 sigma-70 family RNA polymerase sigma factor [Streptococcus anginosus]
MEFKELYGKVRGIVLKCRRDYYVHLWELSDWDQESMLVLYQLVSRYPQLVETESQLYVYYKTKFRNHILDILRKQESQKRKLDCQAYEEVSEIGHKLSLKELYLDELVILRDQLKSYQAQLSPEKQEQYERLLADERFKGRQAMIRELRAYLKDYSD